MDVYSWFRRSPSSANGQITKQEPQRDKAEEELFGVTDQLIDFIKTFTVETFKNFPLQDEEAANCDGVTGAGNVRKDLSEWQERHATLVLSKVKWSLDVVRLMMLLSSNLGAGGFFMECSLVLLVDRYELRAVQSARLRQMTNENENAPNASAYEVEMSETKQSTSNLDSVTHDIESGKE
ncbi:hypothetical protein RHSIM_Rhsim13G0044900 [Rhododendron simsii]|uniref:Uncharacterized protein n=1 Tax=Rhododendron simsii TaxID=118357 RepID=A0A834FYF0_RHOSS|nr:hypothetical protein RHSIM_Rhsim13G0044900 [Rhododendron simsii]